MPVQGQARQWLLPSDRHFVPMQAKPSDWELLSQRIASDLSLQSCVAVIVYKMHLQEHVFATNHYVICRLTNLSSMVLDSGT